MNPVTARLESLAIPTYGLGQPEKNPVFFEKRVYQGSCGKVYPVPFIDKVYQDEPPKPVDYVAARMENEFVRLVMLPEIGGRIFLGQDKANRDYDFFYRQDVIKPALVGLAGPWISGGVEFNWPQHHRPGTYLPADVMIENEGGGVFTVWQSEHDPLNRLKGMHGIRLRPGSALVELRGSLYNRTPFTQTFLWWANVAARVHENYQSFFPADVHYVADHAVRAMSSFPIAENFYYGVDYAARPGANDLAWYKNIPVPTSYMVCQTQEDFFGGYDHDAQGGFIHVANKHISPGKKQWTWGNHEFGWAWDRELTDNGGPYVELMAGVFTDNQPDFSYLAPYETKTFSQYWWPYQKLGPVQQANTLAALRLLVRDDRSMDFGLAVSRPMEGLRVILKDGDRVVLDESVSASPDAPWQREGLHFTGDSETSLCVWVFNSDGEAVIGYRPPDPAKAQRNREVATEPPAPEDIASSDELYLTGEHLDLYRHPTRYPEIYWEAVLQRDPKDSRCNITLGRQKLSRGQFDEAARHFEAAISRLTLRHPNPETGEAHYFLGLVHRFQGNASAAYPLFAKAAWNFAWRAAANFELACLDLKNGDTTTALRHVEESLETHATNNKAQVLKAICLRKLGRATEAIKTLEALLAVDRLDHWALAELTHQQKGAADSHRSAATMRRPRWMLPSITRTVVASPRRCPFWKTTMPRWFNRSPFPTRSNARPRRATRSHGCKTSLAKKKNLKRHCKPHGICRRIIFALRVSTRRRSCSGLSPSPAPTATPPTASGISFTTRSATSMPSRLGKTPARPTARLPRRTATLALPIGMPAAMPPLLARAIRKPFPATRAIRAWFLNSSSSAPSSAIALQIVSPF